MIKKILNIFLITIIAISCSSNKTKSSLPNISNTQSSYSREDVEKRNEVGVGVIDNFYSDLFFKDSKAEMLNKSSIESRYSHGNFVSLNLSANSINSKIYGYSSPTLSMSDVENGYYALSQKGVNIFNFSFGTTVATPSFVDAWSFNDFFETALKKDNLFIISGGNSIFPDPSKSIIGHKDPTLASPAVYPKFYKESIPQIIAVVGVLPVHELIYEKGKIYEGYEVTKDIYSDITPDYNKLYGSNKDFYLASMSGYNFAVADSISKRWTVAADASGLLKFESSNNGYRLSSIGSSFSAPKVTALAADIQSKYPFMTRNQIKQTILTTADLGDLNFLSNEIGWGIVDYNKAMNGPARLIQGLVVEDKFSPESENGKYFVLDIPNGEYTFSNDILGGFKSENIYGYSDLAKDAGIKKLGFGTINFLGSLKFNNDILINQGTLNISKDVTGNIYVKNGSILGIKNKLTLNNSLYLEDNSKVNVYEPVLVLKSINAPNLRIFNIQNGYLQSDNLNIFNKNEINDPFRTTYIDGNKILSKQKDSGLTTSAAVLARSLLPKISTLSSMTLAEIESFSGQIYKDNFNNQINSYLLIKDNIYKRLSLIDKNQGYIENIFEVDKLSQKNLNDILTYTNATQIGYEYKVNSKNLFGLNVGYLYDTVNYDKYDVKSNNHLIYSNIYHKLKLRVIDIKSLFNIGYSFDNVYDNVNNKFSNSNTSNLYLSTSLELKFPILRPYMGIGILAINKSDINENGSRLLIKIPKNIYSKTDIFYGFNAYFSLGTFNLVFNVNQNYEIRNNLNLIGSIDNINNISFIGINSKQLSTTVGITTTYDFSKNLGFSLDYNNKDLVNNSFKLGFYYKH